MGRRGERRDLPRVAGDEDFGETEHVDAFLAGVFDDGDCFCDGAVEVEPDWFGLDGAEADRFFRHF